MYTTTVFSKNIDAYVSKEPLIVNQGGTSSSKTFSILQLLFIIAYKSKRPLIISVVSYALPHLKLGAIRDFENILAGEGYRIDDIKNKTDLYYKIGQSTIEFFSADNLGKVHGPRRDILYLNECNHLKYEVYTQLQIRTRLCTFLDYNPTNEFWVHTDVIPHEKHVFIKSTYKDNEFLEKRIVDQIESRKHNENWWRVYGQGEVGRLEGAILQNWEWGKFNEQAPYLYGLDFGVKDPDALVKVGIDKKNKVLYWKQEVYQTGNSTGDLAKMVKGSGVGNKLIIADSASNRTIIDLSSQGLNIKGVKKNKIVDDIKTLSSWKIIVDPESYDLGKELQQWVWLDKRGEIPLDDFNHLIDAGRYASVTIIKPKSNKGHRVIKKH